MKKHKWSVGDDKEALKAELLGYTREQAYAVADRLVIKRSSFLMRMLNFKYLITNGKEGLSNYAAQSKGVYETYMADK